MLSPFRFSLITSTLIVVMAPATAQPFEITGLFNGNAEAVGVPASDTPLGIALDGDDFVFLARDLATFANAPAIYRGRVDETGVTTLAQAGDAILSTSTSYDSFLSVDIYAGQVASLAIAADTSNYAVSFPSTGSSSRLAADVGNANVNPGNEFSLINSSLSVNSDGTVAVVGITGSSSGNLPTGLYAADISGSTFIPQITNSDTPPAESRPFGLFTLSTGAAANGRVAFRGNVSGSEEAVFIRQADATLDQITPFGTVGGTYSVPVVSSYGSAAYLDRSGNDTALKLYANGITQTLVTDSTLAPDGSNFVLPSSLFSSSQPFAVDGNDVVFFASTENGTAGLYLAQAGEISALIESGDILDNKTVAAFAFESSGFSQGRVAFTAAFSDNSTGSYLISNISNPLNLVGDYNGNGEVDAADYTIWADNFNATVNPFDSADGNGDGVIDAADYTVWADNFGNTTVLGSGYFPIPEPTSLALLTLGGTLLLSRYRTR